MCGDATSRDDVEALLDGVTADLTLTDPPYGISIVKDNRVGKPGVTEPRQYDPIIGDETSEAAQKHYLVSRDHSRTQIFFGGNHFADFLPVTRCWLVWDKQTGNNEFADGELAWTSLDKPLRIYQWRWSGMIRKGERRIELKERIHPTQKPVGLLKEILEDFTEENASVLDCFAGSGSTLIACEVSNRTCYAMELSPSYCEKIIGRWETLTGQKAALISNS